MTGISLELTNPLKALWQDTARRLQGTERRQFMAPVVQALGPGGQRGPNGNGLEPRHARKGLSELAHGPDPRCL